MLSAWTGAGGECIDRGTACCWSGVPTTRERGGVGRPRGVGTDEALLMLNDCCENDRLLSVGRSGAAIGMLARGGRQFTVGESRRSRASNKPALIFSRILFSEFPSTPCPSHLCVYIETATR